MIKLSEIIHLSRTDRPDEWSMDDYSREAKKLEDKAAELEELLKETGEICDAVAHVGVDFGYGVYVLEDSVIHRARLILEELKEQVK
jgi:hypothetical protein